MLGTFRSSISKVRSITIECHYHMDLWRWRREQHFLPRAQVSRNILLEGTFLEISGFSPSGALVLCFFGIANSLVHCFNSSFYIIHLHPPLLPPLQWPLATTAQLVWAPYQKLFSFGTIKANRCTGAASPMDRLSLSKMQGTDPSVLAFLNSREAKEKEKRWSCKKLWHPNPYLSCHWCENIGVGVPHGVRELAGVTVLFIYARRGPLFWLQCHFLYRTVMPSFTTVVIPRVSEWVADTKLSACELFQGSNPQSSAMVVP